MSGDRRLFHRLDGIVNVRYAVKGRDRIKAESLPRNIGGGGIGVCLTEKLSPGTLLELEIIVPDNPEKAVLGTGQVQWSKPFGTIGAEQRVDLHETGVQFVDIDPVAVGRVYSYHRQGPQP